MNRRAFLTGLLASASAPAIAKALPALPTQSSRTICTFREIPIIVVDQLEPYLDGLSQKVTSTIIYGNPTEWQPVNFTGFIPRYATTVIDVIDGVTEYEVEPYLTLPKP